jgi:glutamate/tyrosine decarboxylase-like PLP-dependent enzyme
VTEHPVLRRSLEHASRFLEGLPARPVRAWASPAELRAALEGPLADDGVDPTRVVDELASAADPGLVASAGARYFGFVIGGGLPAALGADWLASAWDQDAGLYACGPSAAVVEGVAAGWLLELLALPRGSSVGFVTGGQMANFTGLIAGRHAVLKRAGWDVEEDGLTGAPPVHLVVGAEAHVTILTSFRMLGLGSGQVKRVDADAQGRMRADALRKVLASCPGPALVCAQAGNVNTGAFDPFAEITEAVRDRGAWLHVDGAFGLWAAASPERRHLLKGVEAADSWATDAHKWLNVPYDSGLSFVADSSAHHAAMTLGAAYYVETEGAERDPYNWVPESSRRARGFTVWAALRSLGRSGVADMISRDSQLARQFAGGLSDVPGVRVLNEVVLNQVLVRFDDASGEQTRGDARTDAIIRAIQDDGTLWLGGTTWHGMRAMRISVSGWATTREDVQRSLQVILREADRIQRA